MRILLFSDVHFSNEKTNRAYEIMLRDAKKIGDYDLIISLGDNIHGDNNQGMLDKKAKLAWNEFFQRLEDAFPSAPKKFIWGGHDVCYHNRFVSALSYFKLGWMIGAGAQNKDCIRKEIFELTCEIMGPPWQAFTFEGFTIIMLNSEIIRAFYESTDPKNKNLVSQLASEQLQFLSRNLESADKAIFIIHDPNTIKCLRGAIGANAKKIALILTGHFHLPLIGKIFGLQPFLRKLNFKIVPSPLGLVLPFSCIQGRYRFCVLEISNGKFNFSYHK